MSALGIGLLIAIAAFPIAWVVAGWGGVLVLLVVLMFIVGQEVASRRRKAAAAAMGHVKD